MFYLPQKPYLFRGTLKEQIIYPLSSSEDSSALTMERFEKLMEQVNLTYMLDIYNPEKVFATTILERDL